MKIQSIFTLVSILILFSCTGKPDANSEEIPDEEPRFRVEAADEIWRTDTLFSLPLDLVYDSTRKYIFVVNRSGGAEDINGKGYITRMYPDGRIDELDWVGGLDAPSSLAIMGDHLFVTDINKIFEFDIEEAIPVQTHRFDSSSLISGIQFVGDSTLQFYDFTSKADYYLKHGKISVAEDPKPYQEPEASPPAVLIQNPEEGQEDLPRMKYIVSLSIYLLMDPVANQVIAYEPKLNND